MTNLDTSVDQPNMLAEIICIYLICHVSILVPICEELYIIFYCLITNKQKTIILVNAASVFYGYI